MGLKAGYKQTDVGVLPAEWSLKTLGELFSFKNGVNADKRAYGTGVRFINVLETISHSHLKQEDIVGRVALPDSIVATYVVKRGDVLFNRTSETDAELALAATYVGSEQVVFGGFVIRGRPNSGELDPDYCGYALRSQTLRAQIIPLGQGAVRANIGQENLGRVLAPVPNLKEQRAIAAALLDVDALITGLERLLAKKRDIKQAAMQQLLTGKIRLPGFSGVWKESRLGELSVMNSGGTPATSNPAYYDGEIPWVSISDMTKGGKHIGSTERNLTVEGLANCAAQIFPVGTVLYAMYASLGECAIAGVPLCSSQAILGIRPNSCLSAEFLYYHLVSKKPVVKALGQHGTQANLNKRIVQGFEIQLPEIEEQDAIATVLSDMDIELSALNSRLTKTRAIKQGMMQELLTGRTRLV